MLARDLIVLFAIGINVCISKMANDQNVLQFFSDCKNDGLNIRWAHAVNSWLQLNETLNLDPTNRVHMIESDVIIRQSSTDLPVMGHPPSMDSDLTFEDWLNTIGSWRITDSNGTVVRMGAKADFKSIDAAKSALRIIQRYLSSISIPLWLNADICRGPGGVDPVDAVEFLRSCTDYGPGFPLSLGWTLPKPVDQFRYSSGHELILSSITDMYHLILPFIQETASNNSLPRITFAVPAALVRSTFERLLWLLDNCASATGSDRYADYFSITLWTSASAYNLTHDDYLWITKLRSEAGKNRVFIDLPSTDIDHLKALDQNSTTAET